MVVPGPNLLQCRGEFVPVRDGFPRQFPLHRADESFNPPILPGASRLDPLLTDAQEPGPKSEQAGDQHGLVVRSQELWPTISFHCLNQFP